MRMLRVAACQIDPVVGDLDGNADRIVSAWCAADRAGCELAVTPELAVTGYPPEDLLLKPRFVDDNLESLDRIARATRNLQCVGVIGFVDREAERLFDAAAVIERGVKLGVYRKHLLPNYAVFDEERYFEQGPLTQRVFRVRGVPVAVLVCEDLWQPEPAQEAARSGASLIVSLNGSPFYRGRLVEREQVVAQRARESGCPIVYVNQVGGQDELVFDGASMIVSGDGTLRARSPQFVEDLLVVDVEVAVSTNGEHPEPDAEHAGMVDGEMAPDGHPGVADLLDPDEEVYEALVLGTRDYVRKNGFTDALVAMSGGIDSSLVAAIASDALGPDHVHGVGMPSRFSSEGSWLDAEEVARRLGIDFRIVPIEQVHAAFLSTVGDQAREGAVGDQASHGAITLAEENLQSRIRGVIIMFLSNQNGWIVLTTGNKSELAVGYSTLYGDTAGGFAVIKDVPKTMVYDLCRYRNRRGSAAGGEDTWVIPESILTKPPSAELRPDQRDDQSLPPYEVLDKILEAYVEEDVTVSELVDRGVDPALAGRIARLVDLAEYKRRQNPPGVRVTPKAFGKDRRMPITNGYSGRRHDRPHT